MLVIVSYQQWKLWHRPESVQIKEYICSQVSLFKRKLIDQTIQVQQYNNFQHEKLYKQSCHKKSDSDDSMLLSIQQRMSHLFQTIVPCVPTSFRQEFSTQYVDRKCIKMLVEFVDHFTTLLPFYSSPLRKFNLSHLVSNLDHYRST